jgi:hypothetical protein
MKDGGSDGVSVYEFERKGGDPAKYMQWKNDEAAQRYYRTSASQIDERYLHPDSWHGRMHSFWVTVPPNLLYCLIAGVVGGILGSSIILLLMR